MKYLHKRIMKKLADLKKKKKKKKREYINNCEYQKSTLLETCFHVKAYAFKMSCNSLMNFI